jgi:hypothetical protein
MDDGCHECQTQCKPLDFRLYLHKITYVDWCQKLMGQADRGATVSASRQPRGLAECTVHKRHQHSAMDNAIPIGVDITRDKCQLPLPCNNAPPHPPNMANKAVIGVNLPTIVSQVLFHADSLRHGRRVRKHRSAETETNFLLWPPEVLPVV